MEQLLIVLKSLEMNCHFWHLEAKGIGSHAAHKQFQVLYETLNGLFDDLAETYCGVMNKAEEGARYNFNNAGTLNIIPLDRSREVLIETSNLLAASQIKYKDQLHIQNILCELQQLTDSSIFLLTFK